MLEGGRVIQAVADDYVQRTLENLFRLSERCLLLFEKIPLRSRTRSTVDGKRKATVLAPSRAQRAEALSTYSDYREWLTRVTAFLARLNDDQAKQFEEMGEDFASYLMFSRIGHDISPAQWRNAFRREVQLLTSLQAQLVLQNPQAFSLMRSRPRLVYSDFIIQLRQRKGKRFRTEARCDFGEAEQDSSLPFDRRELEMFVLRHCLPRGNTRSWSPTPLRPLIDFGARLFDAVIAGSVRDLFLKAQHAANLEGRGLRIRLSVGPDLGQAPWELLYDGKGFLCLSASTPVTRYLNCPPVVPGSLSSHPIRILVTVSSPNTTPSLDQEEERHRIEIALGPLVALGLVKIEFTLEGNLRNLQRMLRSAEAEGHPYYIWHFIGHGVYGEAEEASFLLFEGSRKEMKRVSGFELGTLFSSHAALKVVVINACKGARSGREDVFSGVASALVERGVNAVVAMQFDISNEAAIIFAEEFYAALSDGLPIDAAVSEARRAIFFAPNYTEWITPVLFARAPDVVTFEVNASPVKE